MTEDQRLQHVRRRIECIVQLRELLGRLAEASAAFDADLSEYCDGPERDTLRSVIAEARAALGRQNTQETGA